MHGTNAYIPAVLQGLSPVTVGSLEGPPSKFVQMDFDCYYPLLSWLYYFQLIYPPT